MLTQEQIMNALKHVEDPELHKSIVELNMVRNIQMNGTEVKLDEDENLIIVKQSDILAIIE